MCNSIDDTSQIVKVQDSINCIVNWAETWGLKLSYNTCQHMRVSLHKTNFPSTYSLCGDLLPSVVESRDLVVTVDCSFVF